MITNAKTDEAREQKKHDFNAGCSTLVYPESMSATNFCNAQWRVYKYGGQPKTPIQSKNQVQQDKKANHGWLFGLLAGEKRIDSVELSLTHSWFHTASLEAFSRLARHRLTPQYSPQCAWLKHSLTRSITNAIAAQAASANPVQGFTFSWWEIQSKALPFPGGSTQKDSLLRLQTSLASEGCKNPIVVFKDGAALTI
eukprot:3177454-Amphidinium_carterae.1